jgi:hypothetical protein
MGAEKPAAPRRERHRWPRRAASAVAALLLCAAVAAVFLPWLAVPSVPPSSGAIVVAGPWLAASEARAARRALCEALDRERRHDPLLLLNLVEVLLHENRTKEALDRLKVLRGDRSLKDRDRLHEALLQWIAALRAGDGSRIGAEAARLLDLYRKLPSDQSAVDDPSDEVLRPLSCPSGASPCALDTLGRGKSSTSVEDLARSLDAARGVEPAGER